MHVFEHKSINTAVSPVSPFDAELQVVIKMMLAEGQFV